MEVLGIIERHSVPTRIMSAANMNWVRFAKMVEKLKKVGLIEEKILNRTNGLREFKSSILVEGVLRRTNKHRQKRYSLTEKGQEVLSLFRILNEKIEGLNTNQNKVMYPLLNLHYRPGYH